MPSSHRASEQSPAAALASLRRRIAAAAREAGRVDEITLTAVSKQQQWDAIAPVIGAGQRTFGENRVQEAIARWSGRRAGLELRLIGPLQTNKAPQAVELFDVIETLDRLSLGEALARQAERLGRLPRLLVQVNTGEEPQKAGVSPGAADAFIAACRKQLGLRPEGLMCIPPFGEPPAPHFALLREIARRNGLFELSMGMSADFEIAIHFGATAVRIGEALFGPRARSPRHSEG
ncbi:MAG TPA: YggS family pyridoxal phosphate-dependent enzyme [Caulobacteraceae bacterium]|nr:YggS family pyridoxal phosphate-dependent enzyme [Caulobacteraceae bacterium]